MGANYIVIGLDGKQTYAAVAAATATWLALMTNTAAAAQPAIPVPAPQAAQRFAELDAYFSPVRVGFGSDLDVVPRTPLARRLLEHRRRILEEGTQLLSWEEVLLEVERRRGGAG